MELEIIDMDKGERRSFIKISPEVLELIRKTIACRKEGCEQLD